MAGMPKRRRRALHAVGQKEPLLCGGQKRDGGICGREAGWGTDHPGTGNCKHHGGSTRGGQMKAAKQEINNMATPVESTPAQSLGAVMRLAAGQFVYATQKVAGLTEDQLWVDGDRLDGGGHKQLPNRWVALQHSTMSDLARYAKMAADMGVAERQVDMQEQQVELVASAMEQVLAEVGINKEQRDMIGPALREHLKVVA